MEIVISFLVLIGPEASAFFTSFTSLQNVACFRSHFGENEIVKRIMAVKVV